MTEEHSAAYYTYVKNYMDKAQARETNHMEYPMNLIADVISWSDEYLKGEKFGLIVLPKDELPADIEGTIAYLLCRLSDRDRKILMSYYKENMALRTVGTEHNLSPERVRQLIQRSLRKLSSGTGARMLKLGIRGYYQDKMNTLENRNTSEIYGNGYAAGWNNAIENIRSSDIIPAPIKQKSGRENDLIGSIGFSARTYHALNSSGYKTVQDILNADPEKIKHSRGFGRKTCEEIYQKLEEIGCDVEHLSPLLTAR